MNETDDTEGDDTVAGETTVGAGDTGTASTDDAPSGATAPATDATEGDAGGERWRVLVPVEVLEGETIPEPVVELLETLPVVVLGYHVLPEQTPPGQARLQFEDQAQAKLDELVELFREAGGDAETRLVFTQDEEQTFDRVAAEEGCTAVLVPNPTGAVERLLVPVNGKADVERIVDFVAALVGARDIDVTLLTVVETDEDRAAGASTLRTAADRLRAGLSTGSVAEEVVVSETPVVAIADAAVERDAVVMGESAPSLRTFLYGEASERVADRSVGPVIAVRRRDAPDTVPG